MRALIREKVELHPAIEAIDAQEFAGDEWAELEDPPCLHPSGVHEFPHGAHKCKRCGLVVMS